MRRTWLSFDDAALHGPWQAGVPEHERLYLLADGGYHLGALRLVGTSPVVAELPVRVRGMEQARRHHVDRRAHRCEDAGRADEVGEKRSSRATEEAREELHGEAMAAMHETHFRGRIAELGELPVQLDVGLGVAADHRARTALAGRGCSPPPAC